MHVYYYFVDDAIIPTLKDTTTLPITIALSTTINTTSAISALPNATHHEASMNIGNSHIIEEYIGIGCL